MSYSFDYCSLQYWHLIVSYWKTCNHNRGKGGGGGKWNSNGMVKFVCKDGSTIETYFRRVAKNYNGFFESCSLSFAFIFTFISFKKCGTNGTYTHFNNPFFFSLLTFSYWQSKIFFVFMFWLLLKRRRVATNMLSISKKYLNIIVSILYDFFLK